MSKQLSITDVLQQKMNKINNNQNNLKVHETLRIKPNKKRHNTIYLENGNPRGGNIYNKIQYGTTRSSTNNSIENKSNELIPNRDIKNNSSETIIINHKNICVSITTILLCIVIIILNNIILLNFTNLVWN